MIWYGRVCMVISDAAVVIGSGSIGFGTVYGCRII